MDINPATSHSDLAPGGPWLRHSLPTQESPSMLLRIVSRNLNRVTDFPLHHAGRPLLLSTPSGLLLDGGIRNLDSIARIADFRPSTPSIMAHRTIIPICEQVGITTYSTEGNSRT